MDGSIHCLIDPTGNMHITDDADAYAVGAGGIRVNESECPQVRFDLVERHLISERATPSCVAALRAYLEDRVGTPDRLMRFAAEGHLTKRTLADLLDPELRRAYLDACAVIEKEYTAKCAGAGDPCLESGCSIDQSAGEICLEPLLKAGAEYHQACAAAWVPLFTDASHRVAAWRN